MKVLLFNGSPHKSGCTFTALSEVAETLNQEGIETEIIQVGSSAVRGCTACGMCKDNRCVIDDVVNTALEKAEKADGFIFGSPVYYASANGTMLSFMDRLFYAGNCLAFKPAACVTSARRAGTTATIDQMNKYLLMSNMPVVSSQYWNMVHGSNAEDVKKDLEGLQTMRVLGRNMAWILKSIEAGKAAGVKRPELEKRERTNFIR